MNSNSWYKQCPALAPPRPADLEYLDPFPRPAPEIFGLSPPRLVKKSFPALVYVLHIYLCRFFLATACGRTEKGWRSTSWKTICPLNHYLLCRGSVVRNHSEGATLSGTDYSRESRFTTKELRSRFYIDCAMFGQIKFALLGTDRIFVQNFTPPDFQAKNFTP